jgi:hypothetical protein
MFQGYKLRFTVKGRAIASQQAILEKGFAGQGIGRKGGVFISKRTLKHFAWNSADEAVEFLQWAEGFDLLLEFIDIRFARDQFVRHDIIFEQNEPFKSPALDLSFLLEAEDVERKAPVTVVVQDFQIDLECLASFLALDYLAHVGVEVVFGNGRIWEEALHDVQVSEPPYVWGRVGVEAHASQLIQRRLVGHDLFEVRLRGRKVCPNCLGASIVGGKQGSATRGEYYQGQE